MRRLLLPAATLTVLLAVLTYFLAQGTNAPRHEQADALQGVILYDAALQRDVLLGRAGLLPNYDPLVSSMQNLRSAAAGLPAAEQVAIGDAGADIGQMTAAVAEAVAAQEALVEAFKSDNALLRNSLSYFNHLSRRLSTRGTDAPAEIGILTAAMLRFVNAPRQELAREVTAAIDALERHANPSERDEIRSLIAHARFIVQTMPRVDDLVQRIESAPLGGLARTLQDAYLEARAQAARRANAFMNLLYVVALGLMGYIAYLFVRLRANRDQLQARLELERMVAEISSRFVNLPSAEVTSAAHEALTQLASHLRVTGAELVLYGSDASAGARPGSAAVSSGGLAGLISDWSVQGHEVQDCLHVPNVTRLPNGKEKEALNRAGIGSLLAIPMGMEGGHLGAVVFHHDRPRAWREDDIALLHTVAEVFANATIRGRSEAERESLRLRLNRSQRLEAIGTLAGGIAHEFNNILGVIRGYGEMALAALSKDSQARRYVLQIMKAGERAQDIVEQVLAFGRLRDREQRPLDATTVIAEAIDLVRASLPATISLQAELAAQDAVVKGDRTELQQVVVNLATNAAQAMSGSGVIRIALDSVCLTQPLQLSHGSVQAGHHLRLQVSDRGAGIEPVAMEHIFEPFFTTKPGGQGTGLGLSTVHGIVTMHRGAIDVQSSPGKGATFSVYLPWIEAPVRQQIADEEPVPRGHGETILIVEDDEPLMLLGEEMLAALGYEPVGFGDGQMALAVFRADPQRFDLVLTDEVMQELRGTDLAAAVHDIRPDLPIVLMTGHAGTLQLGRLPSAGVREVLEKPLRSRDLGRCLDRHLAGRTGHRNKIHDDEAPPRLHP